MPAVAHTAGILITMKNLQVEDIKDEWLYNALTQGIKECITTAEGSKYVVFVHTDTRPENAIDVEVLPDGVPETGYWAVPVTTGINDAQNVEIKDGVEVGMEVFQQVMVTNGF